MTKKKSFREIESGCVAVEKIKVVSNFRKDFNEDKLKELADNIAKVGVLQPVILRLDKEDLVLVAGERRLRAAKIAGLAEIPYRLLDLTEKEAVEVCALENLHRQDLNPVEEAHSFKALLQSGGYKVEDLAARIDKSISYVYRALRLLDLTDEAQEALIKKEITTGHARLLLCVPIDKQNKFLEEIKNYGYSVSNLENQIIWHNGMSLGGAVFPAGADTPCAKCPFNTANQQNLFDTAVEEGRCTNEKCFKDSTDKFFEAEKGAAEQAGFKWIKPRNNYGYPTFDGNNILDDDLRRKYAKDIQNNPAKFAYSYDLSIKPNRKILICTDEKLNNKITKFLAKQEELKRQDEEENDNGPAEWEIRHKINMKTQELTARALMRKLPAFKLTEECLKDMLPGGYELDLIKESFGLKEINLRAVLAFKPEDIIKFFILLRAAEWDFCEKLEELLGPLGDEEKEKIAADAEAAVKAEVKK